MPVVNGKHYPYTEKGKAAARKAKKAKGMAGGGSVGYNARLDESMGGRSGSKSQSEKSRRGESEGMEKSMGRRKFAGAGTMDVGRKKMRKGGLVTMKSSNTTVRGPHGSTATAENTNQHKLDAMGKLKGQ